MKNNYYSRNLSVALISFLELLERFSYYGMRALVIIYAISEDGLQLERADALSYYGTFSLLGAILVLPAGLISDFILKQRKAVLIGSIISFIGYLSLQGNTFNTVLLAMTLVLIGTSLIKTNLTILLGRCYKKVDRGRNLGFLIYYFAVNMGAFIGIARIGYIGEMYGWNYGFALCAIASFLFVILFLLVQKRLNLVEVQEGRIETEISTSDLLDEHLAKDGSVINPDKKGKSFPLILIVFLILLSGFYWQTYESASIEMDTLTGEISKIELFGIEIYNTIVLAIPSYLTLIFLPILGILWYMKGSGSSINKIAVALFLAGFGAMILSQISSIVSQEFLYILIPMMLFALGEIFISPVIMSYITRLSNVNYSSTIYGLFVVGSFFVPKLLGGFFENLTVAAVTVLSSGLLILIFRKQLVKLAGGLD